MAKRGNWHHTSLADTNRWIATADGMANVRYMSDEEAEKSKKKAQEKLDRLNAAAKKKKTVKKGK